MKMGKGYLKASPPLPSINEPLVGNKSQGNRKGNKGRDGRKMGDVGQRKGIHGLYRRTTVLGGVEKNSQQTHVWKL